MTVVTSVTPLPCLPEAEKIGLFKQFCTDPTEWYCVITKQSIFFPQSGGQPSDLGAMAGCGSIFKVMQVRSTPTQCIIHLGTFSGPDHFVSSVEVVQEIDSERRTLNSVYHTAGHVLNDAVLQLNNGLGIEGHGVSKAHFFPSGSYVEFDGLIASSKKGSIQEKVDELLNSNLKVLTKWWNAEELVAKKAFGLDRYSVPEYEGERTRVTVIDGLSAWACCGTHVEFTGDVGRIIVGGFRRRHGKTSVGYKVGMGRKDCEE
jgi:Ser-tRNA(Ala) deacylase AlaX